MTANPPIRAASVRRLIVLAGALFALALPLALPVTGASAADGPAFGLRIFTGDNPTFLVFRSAKCQIGRDGFTAVAPRERGWRLVVRVRRFSGFHPYKLVRGLYNGTYISLDPPDSRLEYASDFIPPYHIPSGGQISFSDHGNLMGGGFYPMFNSNGSDAVGVAGGLKCQYPKRKHRR